MTSPAMAVRLMGVVLPATLRFDDCFTGNTSQKLEVSTVYAQFLKDGPHGNTLNFTLLGTSPVVIEQSSGGSNPVASMSHTTSLPVYYL